MSAEKLKEFALQNGMSEETFNNLKKEVEESANKLKFEGEERERYVYSQLRRRVKLWLLNPPQEIEGVVIYEDVTDWGPIRARVQQNYDGPEHDWVYTIWLAGKEGLTMVQYRTQDEVFAPPYVAGKKVKLQGRMGTKYFIASQLPQVIGEVSYEEFEQYIVKCSEIEKVRELRDLMNAEVQQKLNNKIIAAKVNVLDVQMFNDREGRALIDDESIELEKIAIAYIGPISFVEGAEKVIVVGRFYKARDGTLLIRGIAYPPQDERRPDDVEMFLEG